MIPDEYCIATSRHARKLRDPRIRQIFVPDEILNLGVIDMTRRDAVFKIYDKERMLIELLSRKNSLPHDYYKEILGNYRTIKGGVVMRSITGDYVLREQHALLR